jgi:hypothetical protein
VITEADQRMSLGPGLDMRMTTTDRMVRSLRAASDWLARPRPAREPHLGRHPREWWSYFGSFGDDIFDES